MGQERVQRVAEEIKKHIGIIIQEHLKDPRVGFVTVTKVDLSRDCRFAKIYFSVLGEPKQVRDTQTGLSRSRGYIRRQLGQRMKLRFVPEIVFAMDENIKYSIHLSELFTKIKDESNERAKGN